MSMWNGRKLDDIVRNGTMAPHPEWTKKEVLDHAHEMYREVEVLRRFIIKCGLHKMKKKAKKKR